jgi:hypothetical protein
MSVRHVTEWNASWGPNLGWVAMLVISVTQIIQFESKLGLFP